MKSKILEIKINLRQPWLVCILLITSIPIFPEYISPILAGLALWAAYKDIKNRGKTFVLGTGGKLMLVYTAFMAVGVLYSAHPFNTFSTFLMWFVMLLAYLALTTVLTNKHRFDTALFSISLIAGIVGLIATFQYIANAVFGLDVSLYFWGWIDNVVYEFFPMDMLTRVDGIRTSSTFTNPNVLAEYLVMVSPFVAYYGFSGKRTNVRLLCRFCLFFAMLGIAFSFSRGAYLALATLLVVICFSNMRKICMYIMAFISALALVPNAVVSRLFSIVQGDSSISARFQIWSVSLQNIAENPILGLGAGVSNSWDIMLMGGVNAPHAHNLALQLLIEGGFISFGIMGMLGWKMLRRSMDMAVRRDTGTKQMGVLLMSFVAGFVVCSMFDFPFMTPKLVGSFLTVIALFDAATRLYLGQKATSIFELVSPLQQRRRVSATGAAAYRIK